MNRLTTHRTWYIVGICLFLCGAYLMFLSVQAYQLHRDREDCKQHLQDNTTRGQEWQACTRLLQ